MFENGGKRSMSVPSFAAPSLNIHAEGAPKRARTDGVQNCIQIHTSDTVAVPTFSSQNHGINPLFRKCEKGRLIWTDELHECFLAAVNKLGVDTARPQAILQLMNIEGLTAEHIKSHLQKYRATLRSSDGANLHRRVKMRLGHNFSTGSLSSLGSEASAMSYDFNGHYARTLMVPGSLPHSASAPNLLSAHHIPVSVPPFVGVSNAQLFPGMQVDMSNPFAALPQPDLGPVLAFQSDMNQGISASGIHKAVPAHTVSTPTPPVVDLSELVSYARAMMAKASEFQAATNQFCSYVFKLEEQTKLSNQTQHQATQHISPPIPPTSAPESEDPLQIRVQPPVPPTSQPDASSVKTENDASAFWDGDGGTFFSDTLAMNSPADFTNYDASPQVATSTSSLTPTTSS